MSTKREMVENAKHHTRKKAFKCNKNFDATIYKEF
jgi:hypothetical protein